MQDIIEPDKLNNIYFSLQQASLNNICTAVLSISFEVSNATILQLKIIVLKTITIKEMEALNKLKNNFISRLKSEYQVQTEIFHEDDKITISDLHTLKYKFFLHNQFIKEG